MSRVSVQRARRPTARLGGVTGNLASALLVVLAVACVNPAPPGPRDLPGSRSNDGPAAPPGSPVGMQDSRQDVPTTTPGWRTTVHVATVGAVSDGGIYLAMDRVWGAQI